MMFIITKALLCVLLANCVLSAPPTIVLLPDAPTCLGDHVLCIPGRNWDERTCDKRCYNCVKRGNPCATNYKDCLVEPRVSIPAQNRTHCEFVVGGLWCPVRNNDFTPLIDYSTACIAPVPALAHCYRKKFDSVDYKDHCYEFECQAAGHLWCDNERHGKKCIALPNDTTCDDTPADSCCVSRKCMTDPNPTKEACERKGCKLCNGICVFTRRPVCVQHKKLNREQCPVFGDGLETEEKCDDLNCAWCPDPKQKPVKCIRKFPETCANAPSSCKVPGITTAAKCTLNGCQWCGADASQEHFDGKSCIEATKCTTCECPEIQRVDCEAETPEACSAKKCRWCENSTTFKCMIVDANGLGEFGMWSECSNSNGIGTQFKYVDSCTDLNPLNCDREYRECDTGIPTEPEVCDSGAIQRYGDTKGCCMSQTRSCGISTLNQYPKPQSDDRKKRSVDAQDIETIDKYPWLGVLYSNATARQCSVTLIANMNIAITLASCVRDYPMDGIRVNFQVYNRSEEIPMEAKVTDIYYMQLDGINNELAMITLDKDYMLSPICQPRQEKISDGMRCVVAGWGKTVTSDPNSWDRKATPHENFVEILPWGFCEQAWANSQDKLSCETHICAGYFDGVAAACPGDEGSPLMCQRCANCGWFLAGIATERYGCGDITKPTVYSNIEAYSAQIEAYIGVQEDTATYENCQKNMQ